MSSVSSLRPALVVGHRRHLIPKLALLFMFGSCCLSEQVWGQMFGQRQVGQPINRRQSPASTAAGRPQPGSELGSTVQGNERFVRGNRESSQFVGADAGEAANFVGQVNAGEQTAEVAPAITVGPILDRAPLLNQPIRPRRPNSLMNPPLSLGFVVDPETIVQRGVQAQTALGRSLSARFGHPISVSVAGPIASLHGVVADAESARLAEWMVSMEPGIEQVQNRLTYPGKN